MTTSLYWGVNGGERAYLNLPVIQEAPILQVSSNDIALNGEFEQIPIVKRLLATPSYSYIFQEAKRVYSEVNAERFVQDEYVPAFKAMMAKATILGLEFFQESSEELVELKIDNYPRTLYLMLFQKRIALIQADQEEVGRGQYLTAKKVTVLVPHPDLPKEFVIKYVRNGDQKALQSSTWEKKDENKLLVYEASLLAKKIFKNFDTPFFIRKLKNGMHFALYERYEFNLDKVREALNKKEERRTSEEKRLAALFKNPVDLLNVFIDFAKEFSAFHAMGYFNGDPKPTNMGKFPLGYKVFDFGGARKIEKQKLGIATPGYLLYWTALKPVTCHHNKTRDTFALLLSFLELSLETDALEFFEIYGRDGPKTMGVHGFKDTVNADIMKKEFEKRRYPSTWGELFYNKINYFFKPNNYYSIDSLCLFFEKLKEELVSKV